MAIVLKSIKKRYSLQWLYPFWGGMVKTGVNILILKNNAKNPFVDLAFCIRYATFTPNMMKGMVMASVVLTMTDESLLS